MSKLLIYTPLMRLYGRALQSILRLKWDGPVDVVFARGDDSTCPRDNYAKVVAKYQRGRDILLAGDYDAMLTVEDDMIVPADAAQRLWATGADVAYGLYVWRRDRNHLWSAYTELTEDHGTSLSQDYDAAREAWGKVIEVQGIGNGCTLIRRHVLERINFEHRGNACCDWYLALDARYAGFRQVCDTAVVCGHMAAGTEEMRSFPIVIGQAPVPRIYWPDNDAAGLGKLYRVEYL